MITTANLQSPNFSIYNYDVNSEGIFLNSDGTKMYFVGFGTDEVEEFRLTIPWNISSAVWIRKFSVAAKDVTPRGFYLRSDGVKMYIGGDDGKTVDEYTLGIPWNVSTAVYAGEKAVAADGPGVAYLHNPYFKPDGTKMYFFGIRTGGGGRIFYYTLSSAWDITSASYVSETTVDENNAGGIFMSSDGVNVFIAGDTFNKFWKYTLSTPWDITTISAGAYILMDNYETHCDEVWFNSEGTRMYVAGYINDLIWQFNLSTAWDINTAQLANKTGGLIFA